MPKPSGPEVAKLVQLLNAARSAAMDGSREMPNTAELEAAAAALSREEVEAAIDEVFDVTATLIFKGDSGIDRIENARSYFKSALIR